MIIETSNRHLAKSIGVALILSIWMAILGTVMIARAQSSVVHAVLFYSTSCGHCQKVITQDLPPLLEKYGDRLSIIGINVEMQEGQELYRAAIERYQIPQERIAVPCLIAGETIMVGSLEIPEQFPSIIDAGLAGEGIPWPEIPGLAEILPEVIQESASQANPESVPEPIPVSIPQSPSLAERFTRDLAGNTLSVVVLLAMLASAVTIGSRYLKSPPPAARWPLWVTPLLVIIGLGIALYLSYIEITLSQAACGPIGDCNTVQQSSFARLFGVLPVGVLGAAGYIAILIAWLAGQFGPSAWQNRAKLGVWGLVWFGLLFSIYLTFLEPFVIGATCIWCLSSAVIMTLLLWSTIPGNVLSSASGSVDGAPG